MNTKHERYLSGDDPEDLRLRDLPAGTLVQTWFPGGVSTAGDGWLIYDSTAGGAGREVSYLGCFNSGVEICIYDRLRALIALGGGPVT